MTQFPNLCSKEAFTGLPPKDLNVLLLIFERGWVGARAIVQQEGVCLLHGQPRFDLWHLIWSPEIVKIPEQGHRSKL